MAEKESYPTDLEDPDLKGEVDYSFFGDEEEIFTNKKDEPKISYIKEKAKSSSSSNESLSKSPDRSMTPESVQEFQYSDEEKQQSPIVNNFSSTHSKSPKSAHSGLLSPELESHEKEPSLKSKSPSPVSKSRSPSISSSSDSKSSSSSRSSSRSSSPPSKLKSISRSPSPPEVSKSQSSLHSQSSRSKHSSRSVSKATSRAEEEKETATNGSDRSRKSTPKSESNKSSLSAKLTQVLKNETKAKKTKSSNYDSDTTVTSLSEDSPKSSPKSGRKSSSRNKKGHGSQKSTSRSQEKDLNAQRDADVINAGLVMKAMLSLDRERRSNSKSREAWLDPSSKARNPSQIINVDEENNRLVNYLVGKSNAKSFNLINRPHHSTINRQEFQRRIEYENKWILNRLNEIHPTPGMKRTDHLEFYRIQSGYGVIPIDKAPLRRTRLNTSPFRKSDGNFGRRNSRGGSSRYPKTFQGAKSSRPEWASGW